MKRWGMQSKREVTADAAHRILPLVAIMPAVFGLWVSAAHAGFVNESTPAATADQALGLSMSAPGPVSGSVSVGPAAPAPSVTASALSVPGAANDAVISGGARVTQIGFHPADVEIPKGQGREVALSYMLPVIVPHDYRVIMGDVDPTLLVTWSGGLPWDQVLTNALAPLPGVHVSFDWTAHTVSLHRGIRPADGSPLIAQSQPTVAATPVVTNTDMHAGRTPASAPARAAAVPVVVGAGSTVNTLATPDIALSVEAPFSLLGGQSLEMQLVAWAKRAGWAISWNTPDDWIVPHDLSYGTDFEGAIKSVLTQLASNGADVRADIWKGNKSVVVDKAGVSQ